MNNRLVKGTNRLNKGIAETIDKKEIIEKYIVQAEYQKEAIIWNKNYVGKKRKTGELLSKHFDNIELKNNSLIIQMYREIAIPAQKMIFDNENKILSWSFEPQQIDARKHVTQTEDGWVPNPIPVIFKGVVVAVSPEIKLEHEKKKQEHESLGLKYDVKVPEVGDIVYTNFFMTKDRRYYIDKNEMLKDSVTDPRSFTLDYFDYLFKITTFEIESIIKEGKNEEMCDTNHPYENIFMNLTRENIKDYIKLQ